LPAQDGFVSVQLGFELRDELLHAFLVRRLPEIRPVHFLEHNLSYDWFELCILDARRLLEPSVGLRLSWDQLLPRPELRDVATDGARLEQLEAIVLLDDKDSGNDAASDSATIGDVRKERDDAQICKVPGRKAGARGTQAAYVRWPGS
jgi:hypothetical protein